MILLALGPFMFDHFGSSCPAKPSKVLSGCYLHHFLVSIILKEELRDWGMRRERLT